MDITIKVEISPSPEMVTLINAILLFNHPNPTVISATGQKSEIAKNVAAAERMAEEASEGPGPEPKKEKVQKIVEGGSGIERPAEETKPKKKKKNEGVDLESLKVLATTLRSETDFDPKEWLKKKGYVRMLDLKEEDYSDCFDELMQIAGENNVQTF